MNQGHSLTVCSPEQTAKFKMAAVFLTCPEVVFQALSLEQIIFYVGECWEARSSVNKADISHNWS